MKSLLQKDKKGVSLMIGYVLLVVIAVGLGTLVFTYLKIYLPNDKPVCPSNVAVSIEQSSCSNGIVKVQLMNRGLFNLDGTYIRIGEKDREFRELLNSENVRFTDYFDTKGLPPGNIWPRDGIPRSYDFTGDGSYILEVEPALFIDDEWVLCNEAIIKQDIECGIDYLWINIIKPGLIENQGDVPIEIEFDGLGTLSQCSYNITDTSGENLFGSEVNINDCDDNKHYNGIHNLNSGNYLINAHAEDVDGNKETKSEGFEVLQGEFILNSPTSNLYEYIDTVLDSNGNVLLDYDFNYLATSCRVELFDPFGISIQRINQCVYNYNMPPSFFDVDSKDGNYELDFTNRDNGALVFTTSFGVEVDPDFELSSSVRGPDECDIDLDYVIWERKYELLPEEDYECYIDHIFNGNGQGLYYITPCFESTSGTYNFEDLANGQHEFMGHVEDVDGRIGTDTLILDINGGVNCNDPDGGIEPTSYPT